MAIATLAERGELSRAARSFLRTEAGSAVLLLGAAVLALLWTNLVGGYEEFWHTELTLPLGAAEFGLDLRHWVNDGLMVLSSSVSAWRSPGQRRWASGAASTRYGALLGALGGLVVPAGLYLLFNAGGPGAAAWGVPISTDTAALLGVLALVGPRCPDQLRVFLLALAIVDDIGAVLAIALFYTDEVDVVALLLAVRLFACLLGLRFVHFWRTPVYVLIGVAMWFAVLRSGVHPSVVGVAMGLLVNAYAPRRHDIARVQVAGPQLHRRSDGGPRRRSAGRGDGGGLAERTAAAADPAVEQLRDRAAVRAGERGRGADGGDAARRRDVADDVGASSPGWSWASRSG